MTTKESRSRTTPIDSLPSLEVAFRDLGFAVKSLQLYPPTSPVVKGAIERSYRSFAPLLGSGHLRLHINPGFIRVNEHTVGVGIAVVEQLARRMHTRGIAKLHFDERLEPDSLQALSEIVAYEPKAIDELGGIAKVFASFRLPGVLAEFLDLDRLFADSEVSREENVWDAILEGYRLDTEDNEDIDWKALATSIDQQRDFIGWLATNLDAVADRTGYESIDVLRFVLDRLGSISQSLTSDHVSLLALAVRLAFDQFDPDVLVELLADPVEIAVEGEDEDGVGELNVGESLSGAPVNAPQRRTIDIGTYIASGLDPEQAEKLILHALRTRQPSTPRLYGLFERLTHGRPEREEMARHVEESFSEDAAQGDEHSEFLANWPRLFDVLNGEAPQRFLSHEYEAGLQELLSPIDLDNAWPIERIKPRLSEMAPSFITLRKSLMVARLLNHEIDDASYQRLALELERCLANLLVGNQFRTLNKLLKELLEASQDTERRAARREIAAGIVERFYTAETVQMLIELSLGRPRDEVEIIIEIIRARGAQVIPLLLDALADEQTRRTRRRLLRILTDMGDEVGEIVVERLDDDRWFVLRNLAMILGEIGNPSMVEHLSLIFDHTDARVRQEAIASTIQLGGAQAAPTLVRALEDDDPTAYLMAIHGLGHHGDADCLPALRKLLGAPNFRGQSANLIEVAAIAVGRLGDEQSRTALKRLSRRPWFYRSRREPARAAAAWALDLLADKPRRERPEPGVFVDLRPGTSSRRRRMRS